MTPEQLDHAYAEFRKVQRELALKQEEFHTLGAIVASFVKTAPEVVKYVMKQTGGAADPMRVYRRACELGMPPR